MSLSSKMFFSVSNDGEIYRYARLTFTYQGQCRPNTFTAFAYRVLGGIAAVVALLLGALLVFWLAHRRSASRSACTAARS